MNPYTLGLVIIEKNGAALLKSKTEIGAAKDQFAADLKKHAAQDRTPMLAQLLALSAVENILVSPSSEFAEGRGDAQYEIETEGWTRAIAQRYLSENAPLDSDYDRGHRFGILDFVNQK